MIKAHNKFCSHPVYQVFWCGFGALVIQLFIIDSLAFAAPTIKYNVQGNTYSAETESNKVKSAGGGGPGITVSSTDDQYPSAKAVNEVAAAKANDSAVVHNTGNESVSGIKTFSNIPQIPTASLPSPI
jgi:hypothetical protein